MIVTMTDYKVKDNGLIEVHFVCFADPAPYSNSDFYVMITTAESTQNQVQLKTTLTNLLVAKYGSAILDPASGEVKGQGITALNTFKNTQITVAT